MLEENIIGFLEDERLARERLISLIKRDLRKVGKGRFLGKNCLNCRIRAEPSAPKSLLKTKFEWRGDVGKDVFQIDGTTMIYSTIQQIRIVKAAKVLVYVV